MSKESALTEVGTPSVNLADAHPSPFHLPTGNATTGDIAWLALDDSGAGPNDNHDDWVGYVQVTRVPDGGATLALLGGALMAVAALRRKFDA